MFYRRKIILALLQVFDDELDKTRLQKLLFLLSKHQIEPVYDFVPHKYGCYSFSANADLTAMFVKELIIETNDIVRKNDSKDYIATLHFGDAKKIKELKDLYGKMSSLLLTKHTYVNYPFFATKSLIAKEILDNVDYAKVEAANPCITRTTLYTLGYEGMSLEKYLLKLVTNDVKILIDVRKNPLSRKFGFSKTLLKKFCNALGIEYLHLPEVGIQSVERQELKSQSDYDRLFTSYKANCIPSTIATQDNILKLLIDRQRVALTCFEANICQCHRKHLAEAIERLPGFCYDVNHL